MQVSLNAYSGCNELMTTTIQLSEETAARLSGMKQRGDTYDDVVNRLLEQQRETPLDYQDQLVARIVNGQDVQYMAARQTGTTTAVLRAVRLLSLLPEPPSILWRTYNATNAKERYQYRYNTPLPPNVDFGAREEPYQVYITDMAPDIAKGHRRFPHSGQEGKAQIVQAGVGEQVQWHDDPIVVPWDHSELVHNETMEKLKQYMPRKEFRAEFEPQFAEEE